jgi:hypothetical protein
MALGEYEDAIDTTLTPPGTQYGATPGKQGKRNRLIYAGFATHEFSLVMRLGQRFASALVRSRRPVRQEVPAIGSTPRSWSHVGLAAISMILFVRYRASESFRASSAIGELLESHNWIGYPDPGLGWLLVKGLRRVPCPPAMRIAFIEPNLRPGCAVHSSGT